MGSSGESTMEDQVEKYKPLFFLSLTSQISK